MNVSSSLYGLVSRGVLPLVLAFLAGTFSMHAKGAELVVESGLLTGATGVLVDGKPYKVSFARGACLDFYDGCNADSFPFTSDSVAIAAGQALLNQVFVNSTAGAFDSDPRLTAVCAVDGASTATGCPVFIPMSTYVEEPPWGPPCEENCRPPSKIVSVTAVTNGVAEASDRIDLYGIQYYPYDYESIHYQYNWTIWAPVPEPSTLALGFVGGVVLVAKFRRRQHKAVGQQPA